MAPPRGSRSAAQYFDGLDEDDAMNQLLEDDEEEDADDSDYEPEEDEQTDDHDDDGGHDEDMSDSDYQDAETGQSEQDSNPPYTWVPQGTDTGALLRLLLMARGYQQVDPWTTDLGPSARRRRRRRADEYPKVPSLEGQKLMASGKFGAHSFDREKPLARNRHWRRFLNEIGDGNTFDRERNRKLLYQSLLPITKAELFVFYESPVYSGQFSADGTFFFACGQDFRIRMYDTTNQHYWKHYKTVSDPWGRWTITDASLSPDNSLLAYSSIKNVVHIAPTSPKDVGEPHPQNLSANGESFGVWSLRLSQDKRELIAGTNHKSVVVYDIPKGEVLHTIRGHQDDVNAVCFANPESSHIIYSGSDDATIKVWDRRSMGNGRPAAAFVGHCEGLTYIDSKGDGRYILSNGKDQTMKLWDMRWAMEYNDFVVKRPTQHTEGSYFDYRWDEYKLWFKHPDDNSVVTFRGHTVLRTLIRCHFSPPHSSDSRYVYSGSADGKVYIWNLDASLARVINVRKATRDLGLDERPELGERGLGSWLRMRHRGQLHETIVRDASWHPGAPAIVASSWNGVDASHGSLTVHEFDYEGGSHDHSDSDDSEKDSHQRVFDDDMKPFFPDRSQSPTAWAAMSSGGSGA